MTKMRRLMVIKPHRYGTRHLSAGEEYEAPARHALALLATKKVRYAEPSPRPPGETLPPAPVQVVPEPVAELDRLRAQANQLGIEVDGRWGSIRLQHEITRARNVPRGTVNR